MARRRFFVNDVHAGRAHVRGDEAHHLTRVLRVEAGQQYELSDNHNLYLARVETARKDQVSFEILEKLSAPEASVHAIVAAALIKFERFEMLIEKATELGAAVIVPFAAERSEKGLDRAAGKRVERWRRIARESSEQARRARLPDIAEPQSFTATLAVAAEIRIALDERPGTLPIFTALPAKREPGATVALLVGPEGGWTDREREAFLEAGWRPVSLGRTVLRAETAAIAGLAVLSAAWSNNSGGPESSV